MKVRLVAQRISFYMVLLSFLLFSGPSVAFESYLSVDSDAQDVDLSLTSLSLVFSAKRDGITNPQEILAAARADYGRLVGVLNEQGYFGPVVSILVDGREAARIPPLLILSRVSRVDVIVTTGPAFKLGVADIGPLAAGTFLPTSFQTGAPALVSAIRDAAQAGVEGWRAVGHATAQIDQQEIIADHVQAELDVRLQLAPGPQVQFGDLKISGAPLVRDNRIREIAAIPSGATFDPLILGRAATRLRRAGAFSSVALREADELGGDNQMDIEIALVEAKPRRFGFGAELQSSEGLSLSGFWLHRNLWGARSGLKSKARFRVWAAKPKDWTIVCGLT